MKRICIFTCLIIFFSSINIFSQDKSLRVGVLNGPTCIPAAYMMENDKSISFQKFADPQALLPKLIKKEIVNITINNRITSIKVNYLGNYGISQS